MRPWFTLIVVFVIGICLVAFLWIVDFVLINRVMFEMPFDITIRVPLSSWEHTWVGVQFMYIIVASVLLGALIIAVTTLGLDTKRTLRLRSMKKELKQLQQALQEAQTALPKQTSQEEQAIVPPQTDEEPVDEVETPSISPDDVTKSFEDAIHKDDFLETAQKRREEELEKHGGISPEGDVRARVSSANEEEENVKEENMDEHDSSEPSESEPSEEESTPAQDEQSSQEVASSAQEQELVEKSPVEAELVEDEEEVEAQTSEKTDPKTEAS